MPVLRRGHYCESHCRYVDLHYHVLISSNNFSLNPWDAFIHGSFRSLKSSLKAKEQLMVECIRSLARKIVRCLKSSKTGKEKLHAVQIHLSRPERKVIQEVETRWNRTFAVLQRLHEERNPLELHEHWPHTIYCRRVWNCSSVCCGSWANSHQATVEPSAEKRLSGSKVTPLIKKFREVFTAE